MTAAPAARRVVLTLALCAASVSAQTPEGGAGEHDRFQLSFRAESYVSLFRRALLPGPDGAVVSTETLLPIQQYVDFRANGLDLPLAEDNLDIEASGWARAYVARGQVDQVLDGDVQTASVRYRLPGISLRLGRQLAAGGAARFTRFDGAALALGLPAGLFVEGYAGFTVLPRWDQRPGYYQLGSAADSLLRDPEALPDPERSGDWLAGGRLGYRSERVSASASLHEQREHGDLGRRNLGLDARGSPAEKLSLSGSTLLDIDGERVTDLRLLAAATPHDAVDVSVDYLHAVPALYLSRQSVLSVFSTDAFDEAGGSAELRVTDRASLEAGGWLIVYKRGEHPGGRSETTLRLVPGPGRRTLVRLGYTRLIGPDSGYHSLRASLSRRWLASLLGTLEAYYYLYDTEIEGRNTSSFYAGSLSYEPLPALELLLGASLASTPYARADASTLLRVGYSFDRERERP
ncbi:MAG TPA: hypothetical protein VM686_43080 [Polyangiaceae bacterium]|nr:hypothetical protein [Polyangiaceae bacterium]